MRRAWLAALALALACGAGTPRDADAPGDPAPAFTLPDLEGRTVTLESFRGRPVVIDFWATWCAPCVFQIPVLNAFQEAHRGDGVAVLGISVDSEGRDVVAAFAQEHDIRYPVLLGSEALAWEYGAPGFPALVVLDAEGRIDSLHLGVVDRDDLEEAVQAVLARPG